jgi:hypothetical protein
MRAARRGRPASGRAALGCSSAGAEAIPNAPRPEAGMCTRGRCVRASPVAASTAQRQPQRREEHEGGGARPGRWCVPARHWQPPSMASGSPWSSKAAPSIGGVRDGRIGLRRSHRPRRRPRRGWWPSSQASAASSVASRAATSHRHVRGGVRGARVDGARGDPDRAAHRVVGRAKPADALLHERVGVGDGLRRGHLGDAQHKREAAHGARRGGRVDGARAIGGHPVGGVVEGAAAVAGPCRAEARTGRLPGGGARVAVLDEGHGARPGDGLDGAAHAHERQRPGRGLAVWRRSRCARSLRRGSGRGATRSSGHRRRLR